MGKLIRTLTGHTGYIHWSVDLLNSQTLVSGSGDGTIKLWNWSTAPSPYLDDRDHVLGIPLTRSHFLSNMTTNVTKFYVGT